MFGKLVKYEWKAIWPILLITSALVAFATLLGFFAMNGILNDNSLFLSSESISGISILIFLLYYLMMLGASFAIAVYIAIRYYRSMYTDEGYLMHTLPVSAAQLFNSRLLIHSLSILLVGILVLLSVAVVLLPIMAVSVDSYSSITAMLNEWNHICLEENGFSLQVLCIILLLTIVISSFSSTCITYCAISLGQHFRKHKVVGAILCYAGFTCLLQIIFSVLTMPQLFFSANMASQDSISINLAGYYFNTMLAVTIASLIIGAVFYVISLRELNNKLNLD